MTSIYLFTGLQEYIEAVSFCHYLKGGQLISLSEVENNLQFVKPPPTTDPSKDSEQFADSSSQDKAGTFSGKVHTVAEAKTLTSISHEHEITSAILLTSNS